MRGQASCSAPVCRAGGGCGDRAAAARQGSPRADLACGLRGSGGVSAPWKGRGLAERSLLGRVGALPGSRPVLRWFLCPAWAVVTLPFRRYLECGGGDWRPLRHTGVGNHCSSGLSALSEGVCLAECGGNSFEASDTCKSSKIYK